MQKETLSLKEYKYTGASTSCSTRSSRFRRDSSRTRAAPANGKKREKGEKTENNGEKMGKNGKNVTKNGKSAKNGKMRKRDTEENQKNGEKREKLLKKWENFWEKLKRGGKRSVPQSFQNSLDSHFKIHFSPFRFDSGRDSQLNPPVKSDSYSVDHIWKICKSSNKAQATYFDLCNLKKTPNLNLGRMENMYLT